jgi:hypothetical protein
MTDPMRKRISVAGIRNDLPRGYVHTSSRFIDFELLHRFSLCFEDNIPYLTNVSVYSETCSQGVRLNL